jgi:hypothetical protein
LSKKNSLTRSRQQARPIERLSGSNLARLGYVEAEPIKRFAWREGRRLFAASSLQAAEERAEGNPAPLIDLVTSLVSGAARNVDQIQNGCHKELAEPGFSTDHTQKNRSHEQTASPEQHIPDGMPRRGTYESEV